MTESDILCLDHPGVNDVFDAVDRDRCLRDICAHNHLSGALSETNWMVISRDITHKQFNNYHYIIFCAQH